MPSIHKQWVTNDCWISSAVIFIVPRILGVMLCSGEQITTGRLVLYRTDPWRFYSTKISASALVYCSCWIVFILLVVTNIGSILFCDMSKVIFTMLSLVKTFSSYAFARHCLSILYKIEAIIQYCEIKFLNILVKASTSVIIFLPWWKIENDSLINPESNKKPWGYCLHIRVFLYFLHNHIITKKDIPIEYVYLCQFPI